ncbi:MAG: class I SAM-dependent methyltransferase [Gemmatimonadales bacterium]
MRGGQVSRYLAELVGPTGRVVGLDLDTVKLGAARDDCDRAGHRNVEFRAVHVAEWTERDTYDLVYGRFILSHLADRAAVVQRSIRRCGARGCWSSREDIDFAGAFCYPPNAAFRRYCDWYCAVITRRGGDALLGPRLFELCLEGGFEGVQVRMVQPIHTGHSPEKALSLSTLVNIGDAVVAEGLATAAELEDTVVQLGMFTEDPRSIIGLPRVFQVCGHRPADPA